MRNSKEISAALDAKVNELKAATDAEVRKTLASDVEALTVELNEANVMEAAVRAQANRRVLSEPEKKELKRFSISKMFREAAEGKVQGFEAEMNEEAIKEARTAGVNIAGVGIPSFVLTRGTYQNASTATEGQEFVGGDTYIEALKNNLVCAQAGVQYIDGLQGTLKLTKGGGATAAWIAEESNASINKQSYSATTLTPKRLQVLAGYTMDLLHQSTIAVDQMIMREIMNEHAAALDAAILAGSGSSGQPTGIMSASGINTVAIDTNGGNITWAKLLEMEKEVGIDNGLRGRLAYVTNAKVNEQLKKLVKISGYPSYLAEDGKVNGYDLFITNAMPANLTKGTSSGVCSAMLFGNFAEAICAQWGGLDFIVDPYSKKAYGVVEISATAFHDVACRHDASFAKIVDITLA